MMLVCFVDDVAISAKNPQEIDELIERLRKKGFELTREGTLHEFLGIKLVRNSDNNTITMTQQGLIQKIIKTTEMEGCNPNWLPAPMKALGIDPDGEPMNESWNYRSVVGMLLYLSTNSRPDICFAVSQVARFSHSPKKSHASAIKTLVRYLSRTADKGTILTISRNLQLECYIDSDFCGLFKSDPDCEPSAARSRTGYIVFFAGCPLIWKSQLQSSIALSTLEAEYTALSTSLRTILPLRSMLVEVSGVLDLPANMQASIHCRVFQDNNGSLQLATGQRLTARTKYFCVKMHHFWQHVRDSTLVINRASSEDMCCDNMTKQNGRPLFEGNRRFTQGW
jgi:hypothetical protein